MRHKLNLKLIAGVLIGLFVVAVVVHLVHLWQVKQNAHRLLELADRAAEANDIAKASVYYSQYLSFVPEDVDTLQKYATVMDRAGNDRVELVGKMEQVLRAKPNEHAFRMRLIENLIALNRIPDAAEHLKKLLGRWGDQAEIHHILGWCHEAKKDFPQAVQSFREAIKINPHQIKSWALLGEVLQDRLKQSDEALNAMNDMVKANEGDYRAILLRSQFHRRRTESAEAWRDLQLALKLGPHQPEVLLEAADWARVNGDTADAIRLLQDGQARYPNNPNFYRALAHVKMILEKRDEAIAHLQEGLSKAPKSNELVVLLIDLMIDQGQYPQAQEKIRELKDASTSQTLPNYLTARLKIAAGQWAEAIKLLEGVRQDLGPSSDWHSRVHVLLGLCYRHLGDREQELLAFRRAVNDEPNWSVANLGLATALLSSGRVEEAVNLLETLRTAPKLPDDYWLLLARALLQRQLRIPDAPLPWTKVEEALAKAGQMQPKSVGVAILQAEMLAAQKEYARAETLLQKCQQDHPGEISVWCARAELAAMQQHWAQAEKILRQAAAQKAFAPLASWRLVQARLWSLHSTDADLLKLARLSDALGEMPSGPERTQVRRELAELWYRLGKWERADRLWREVAQELPRDLPSRSWLLELALQKNQTEDARNWLVEIHKIEGDQGAAWRYGAAAIHVRESHGKVKKLEEARKILTELKKHHQDWPRIPLLSAAIYEMQGQYQNALKEYMRALELGEMQPRMMTRLLELLLERREYHKAELELGKYEQKLPLTKDLARLGAEAALGLRDKNYSRIALRRAELAVTLPSNDYRDLLWLARICDAAGENDRAEKLLRQSIVIAGHTPDTWIALAEHLTAVNRREQAMMELNQLRKELPKNRQPLTLAQCYEAMRMPEEAAKAYRTALSAAPNDFTVLAFAADYFRRADEADEAEKLYERLLTDEVAAPAEFAVKARRQLAILLANRGNLASYDKARALINENVKLRGATVAEERIRLFIQCQQERPGIKTVHQFQDSLDHQPATLEERVLFAQMLEAISDLGLARSQLLQVVDQDPQPAYLVRFARVLLKTGELDEAHRVISRLEELEPNSVRVRAVKGELAVAQAKEK